MRLTPSTNIIIQFSDLYYQIQINLAYNRIVKTVENIVYTEFFALFGGGSETLFTVVIFASTGNIIKKWKTTTQKRHLEYLV